MDDVTKRAAERERPIEDLPVEASRAAEVKGGDTSGDTPGARVQKKWLPAN